MGCTAFTYEAARRPTVTPEKLVYPPEVERRLEALVAAGNREAAVETLMLEVVHVPADELGAIQAQPTERASELGSRPWR